MDRVTILKESAAIRCEICHQKDLFDAEKNCCARCENLATDNIEYGSIRDLSSQERKEYLLQTPILICTVPFLVLSLVTFLALLFSIYLQNFRLIAVGIIVFLLCTLVALTIGWVIWNLLKRLVICSNCKEKILSRDINFHRCR